jgi:hypothetical protein
VPEGTHEIIGRFTDTPVRTIGNLLSLFAIISLGAFFLYERRRDKK